MFILYIFFFFIKPTQELTVILSLIMPFWESFIFLEEDICVVFVLPTDNIIWKPTYLLTR